MRDWQVQGLDLTGHEEVLLRLDPAGALFLGCRISEPTADRLREGGALIFPQVPDVPFDPWRPHLYTPDELYDGLADGYEATADARIYAWSQAVPQHGPLKNVLAKSLHDSSIDDALEEFTRGRRIVGLMGGHALTRDDPTYTAAARLAHGLAAIGADGRHRRRPRRHGGSQPRRPAGRATGGHPRPDADGDRLGPVVRARRRCLGTHCDRQREGPGRLRVLARHPDVALRPRAAERVQLGRGEVLPQRDPRGRPARGLPGRDRVPARRGRHRPGGFPGGVRQLLRRRVGRGADAVRRAASTGRRRCPPGRSSALSPKGGHSQPRPIFSTTRRRCTGCSPGSKARRAAPTEGCATPARRGTISLWPAPRNVCATSPG